eukprot:516654-Prymnesium_polylepis.1
MQMQGGMAGGMAGAAPFGAMYGGMQQPYGQPPFVGAPGGYNMQVPPGGVPNGAMGPGAGSKPGTLRMRGL